MDFQLEKAKEVVEIIKEEFASFDLASVEDKAKSVLSRIKKTIQELGLNVKPIFGGSFAKGTLLPNNKEVDLYLLFDPSYSEEDIKDLSHKIIKKTFPSYEVLHGSRDYFHVHLEDLTFEIVPLVDISSGFQHARNVTDFSPFHVKFVKDHLEKEPNLQREIQVAKLFFKAQNIYGAESYMRGFSGYVVELLIIYYNSFLNLLLNCVKWGPKTILTFPGSKNLIENTSKLLGPLIIVDPVQPDRNASAAVSEKRYLMLKEAAKKFLQKPSRSFFEIKAQTKQSFIEEFCKDNSLLINIILLDGKEDVVAAKAARAAEHLSFLFNKHGFKVNFYDYFLRPPNFFTYFFFESITIPEEIIIRGPPLKNKKNVERFKLKHPQTFEKDGRIYARERRKFINACDLFQHIIEHEIFFKDKAKSYELLRCCQNGREE